MSRKGRILPEGLITAAALGIALMAASFMRLAGDAGSAAFGGRIIESTLDQPFWGTALQHNVSIFASVLVGTHIAFGIACWMLALLSRRAWPGSQSTVRTWTLLWFVLLTGWVLAANAYWYPNSSLGSPYAELVRAEWADVPAFALLTVISAVPMAAMVITLLAREALALARTTFAAASRLGYRFGMAMLGTGLTIAILFSQQTGMSAPDHPRAGRPHIVLIGIDSLRPDMVTEERAPHISRFLDNSTVFTDTLTPLARTFPAWVSIMSGKHPHTTGAIINLSPRQSIDEGATLGQLLGNAGYHTVYAIDEVRFSNLDESYGFQQMISPPIGSTEFLLGFFGDTPLSNLIVNTRLGSMLFPHLHGNRGAAVTYEPDTFTRRLERELTFEKPTFLATHLTLAHWPYWWASYRPADGHDIQTHTRVAYTQAIARVDRQFRDLIVLLERRNVLSNAIVVVVSDHGESLGETANGPPRRAHATEDSDSALFGHGTDVLAAEQYQVVLGIRTFGANVISTGSPARIESPATLEDVAPTILDLAGVRHDSSLFDGISLLPLILDPASEQAGRLSGRVRFTETEFNPPGLTAGESLSQSSIKNAALFYRVDPATDRITIRTELMDKILANRQYAASRFGEMLVSFPDGDGDGQYLAYIGRADERALWLDTPPEAGHPDLQGLWNALADRFPQVRKRPVLRPPDAAVTATYSTSQLSSSTSQQGSPAL